MTILTFEGETGGAGSGLQLFDDGLPSPAGFATGDQILAVEDARLLSFRNVNSQSWRATSAVLAGGDALDIVITPIAGDGTTTTFAITHGIEGDIVDCYVRRSAGKARLGSPVVEQSAPGTATFTFADPPADGAFELITYGRAA